MITIMRLLLVPAVVLAMLQARWDWAFAGFLVAGISDGVDGFIARRYKQFSRLGITGYGFAPLKLPPGLDYQALYHGVDERVPVEALHFGVRVLDRFLSQ